MTSARRVVLALVATSIVPVFVAGCSTQEPGTPSTTPSSGAAGSQASSSTDAGDVPSVSNPLDASSFVGDPCALVPQNVMTGVGYTEPGTPQTEDNSSVAALAGPACGWNDRGKGETVVVAIQTGNQENGLGGLQGLHDAYERGQFEYWEPTTIQDYPAAYSDVSDGRDRGRCRLGVGIADDLSFSVSAGPYSDEPEQACPVVEQVAGAVIETLKGGA